MILPNGEKAQFGQYDWRELIYQMARDNLAAQSRIYGLQAALITLNEFRQAEINYENNPSETNRLLKEDWANHVMYHYDYAQLDRANYAQYYNEATKKDKRFANTSYREDEVCYGIRGIYGKTGAESQHTHKQTTHLSKDACTTKQHISGKEKTNNAKAVDIARGDIAKKTAHLTHGVCT